MNAAEKQRLRHGRGLQIQQVGIQREQRRGERLPATVPNSRRTAANRNVPPIAKQPAAGMATRPTPLATGIVAHQRKQQQRAAGAARRCRSGRSPACANPGCGARCSGALRRLRSTACSRGSRRTHTARPRSSAASAASTQHAAFGLQRLEGREGFEFLVPAIDLLARQRAEAVHAELLAAEAAHHRSIDHRPAQFGEIDRARARIDPAPGQIADEAAGESSRPRRWDRRRPPADIPGP